MLQVMSDEEAVAASDQQIATVAEAMAHTMRMYPDVPVEALSQVLSMVNGQNWMNGSDMARARVKAKAIAAAAPDIPAFLRRTA